MASTDTARAVTAASDSWLAGMARGDADVLDLLTTPDFTYVHSSGGLDSREVFLEAFRSGRRRYTQYSVDDVDVRVLPGVALMRGLVHIRLNGRDGEVKIDARFVSVWTDEDGAWRMLAWQSTRLPEA